MFMKERVKMHFRPCSLFSASSLFAKVSILDFPVYKGLRNKCS